MILSLVEAAIRFRILFLGAAAALIFFGTSRLEQMPVDILPEFDPPLVEIQTEALGLSAADVEIMVSLGVEGLMSGLPWLRTLSSQSIAGLSTVKMEFEPGTNLMRARQLVHERLTGAFLLPAVGKPPVMQQPTSSTNRVMMVALSSKTIKPIALTVLTQWTVKPKLLGVPGVAKIAIWGERRRQLQIWVDQEKLRDLGISQSQVVKAAGESLWVSNLSFLKSSVPGRGGYLDSQNQRMEVRHVLPVSSPRDLSRISIGGTRYTLGDVAKVVEGHPPMIGDAIIKGGNGLLLVIEKFPGANTLEVTRAVEAALDDLRPGLAEIKIDSHAFRPASFVEWSMSNMASVAVIGGLLAVLAMAALLLNWRALAIGIVVIPVSLLAAALVLYAMGATVNTLMLAGFGVAMACIIDDLVVAAESMRRNLAAGGGKSFGGVGVGSLIRTSMMESRGSITFATLISVLAISPVFFLEGLSGKFVEPLALAYVLALLASLLMTVTLVPALTALLCVWLKPAPVRANAAMPTLMQRLLGGATSAMINGRFKAAILALLLVVVSLASLPALYKTMLERDGLMPIFQERDLLIDAQVTAGVSWAEMTRITKKISGELRAIKGVRGVSAHFGRAVSGDLTVNLNSARIWVRIDPNTDYTTTLAAIQGQLEVHPGLRHKLHTYLNDRLGRTLLSSQKGFVVRIYGGNRDLILAKARDVKEALSSVDGMWNLHVDDSPLEPHVQVEVDLAAAAQVGVKPGDVRRASSTLFAGLEVGKIFEAQKVFAVVVWSDPESRHSLENVANAQIEIPGGGSVRLADVADVKITPTPTLIKREGNSQYIDVVAKISGRNYQDVVTDVRQRLKNISFQLGYYPRVIGDGRGQGGSKVRLGAAILIALIGIALLLQAATSSWQLSLSMMVVLPLALSGGLITVLLAGSHMVSLGAVFGLLAVFALTTRQALAMVERYTQLRSRSHDLHDPIIAAMAVQDRVGPVIVAAISIALALMPIVYFADQPGFEFLGPMAVAVIGGLFTSTATVLFIMPALIAKFGSTFVPELNLEYAS